MTAALALPPPLTGLRLIADRFRDLGHDGDRRMIRGIISVLEDPRYARDAAENALGAAEQCDRAAAMLDEQRERVSTGPSGRVWLADRAQVHRDAARWLREWAQ